MRNNTIDGPSFKAHTLLFIGILALAGCQTKALTSACDVLVPIAPLPATNAYLVKQDRKTAEQIAKHRGRYQQYRCG